VALQIFKITYSYAHPFILETSIGNGKLANQYFSMLHVIRAYLFVWSEIYGLKNQLRSADLLIWRVMLRYALVKFCRTKCSEI